jgi:hypothetical protein
MGYLPDKLMIYSDPNPLLTQGIFTFIFGAPVNNRSTITKTAAPCKPGFPSVSSGLLQADLGTGARVSPAFPLFLCSDALPSAPPSSRYGRHQVAAVASHWCSEAGSLNFFPTADVPWPPEHDLAGQRVSDEKAEVARGDL